MPHKQSSLDFDFLQEENIPEENHGLQEPDMIIENQQEPADTITEEFIVNNETIKKSPRGRMKLSEMNALLDQPDIPEDAILFEKSYYSIGAVSEMFKVKQSLIRYWENEFDILKPKKNAKGDRFFRPDDVKNLKMIYHLLRDRKYTIEGAKEFLKKHKNADEKFAMIESLKKIRSFFIELKANL